MDGFTGFKSAAQEALPQAQTVLDPFHVVRWASNMLDECRRRVQQDTLGRRGRKNDPLYKSRRTLLTRISYLSDANKKQLFQLFADEHHLEVDCTWNMYQRVVRDRKSTRLNSSHVRISYAVFCLKKKKK